MKTKFSIKAFLPLICSIGLAIVSILIAIEPMKPPMYFLLGYLILVLVWLIFGEIRNKCIKVHFFPNEYILVKRFFGLYHNIYKINEIEGYKYSLQSSKSGTGSINLWKVYNLFTQANKSSYIDTFLDRNLNTFEFSKSIQHSLSDNNYHWFLR